MPDAAGFSATVHADLQPSVLGLQFWFSTGKKRSSSFRNCGGLAGDLEVNVLYAPWQGAVLARGKCVAGDYEFEEEIRSAGSRLAIVCALYAKVTSLVVMPALV